MAAVDLLCLFGLRVQKATESLKTFQPAANPSFDEFIMDTSKEESLLKDLSFGGGKRGNGTHFIYSCR